MKKLIKRVTGATGGGIAGAIAGLITGAISGAQYGVGIGIPVGLIAAVTGNNFFVAFINCILWGGLVGALLCSVVMFIGGGIAGSQWGSDT